MKKKFLTLGLIAGVAIPLAACGGTGGGGESTETTAATEATTAAADSTTAASSSSTGEKKVFNYGSTSYSPDNLDNGTNPHDGYMGWSCLRYGVGETLFKFTDSMGVEPWLATGYEFVDDTHCKITLRDDVTFSSGRKMDGEAVKECLEDLIMNHDRAPGDLKVKCETEQAKDDEGNDVTKITKVTGITAEGNTVTIETEEPCPALINYLSDPYGCIIDMQVPEKDSIVVGTGPFIATSVKDEEMVLEKNPNYWGGDVKLDELHIKSITDGDTLTAALQAGEIDAAYGLPYASYPLFEGNSAYKIGTCETSRQFFGKMNYKSEVMQDEAVRKAIAMGIDKEGFVTTLLQGHGATSKGPFPASFTFGDDTINAPSYDPEGAKAILDAAGWTVGSDGIREKDGKKLSIKWLTYPSRQELPLLAESAQATLKDIGIDVQINNTKEHKTFWKDGDYDIYVSAMVTAPTGDPEYFFTTHALTDASSNYEGYSNAKLDELAAELHKEFDETKRSKIATEMSQILIDDYAYVFPSHLQMGIVTKSNVSGLEPHACDYYEFSAETDIQ